MKVPRLLICVCCSLCLIGVLSEETESSPPLQQKGNWLLSLWHSIFQTDEFGELDLDDEVTEDTPVTNSINDELEYVDASSNSTVSSLASEAAGNHNVSRSRVKHTCVPFKGCTPLLNCSDLSQLNSSNLEGVVNQGRVVLANLTQIQYLLENVSQTNACVIVMFYTTWCQYSVDFSPVYDKLGRVFPQIPVVAMDFGLQAPDRYLLAYVPRVILYYSGRVVYDIDTTMDIGNLTTVVANMTGLSPGAIPTDEEMSNYDSPLPKEIIEDNTVLWLAVVAVVTIIGGSCVQRSEFFAKCRERMFRVKED